jgi:hypothetical protein
MPPLPWRTKPQPDQDRTYLVMASRLPLRSRRTVPRFLRLTLSVVRQLERTDGLAARAMPHLAVIRRLRPRMGQSRFVFWTVKGSALPSPGRRPPTAS